MRSRAERDEIQLRIICEEGKPSRPKTKLAKQIAAKQRKGGTEPENEANLYMFSYVLPSNEIEV